MHDFKHGRLPISFINAWQTVGEANPRYPLRNASDYAIPRHRIELVKHFPSWFMPRIWNEFNHINELKDILSRASFLVKLKEFTFNQLSSTCILPNCYICNRT